MCISVRRRAEDTGQSRRRRYEVYDGLKAKNIQLDRKTLADLAVREPEAFTAIVKATQK